jgi:hypothetical protein
MNQPKWLGDSKLLGYYAFVDIKFKYAIVQRELATLVSFCPKQLSHRQQGRQHESTL